MDFSLTTTFRELLLAFTFTLPRLIACFMIFPVLSKRALGGVLIRNGLIFTLALYMLPTVVQTIPDLSLSTLEIAAIFIKEIVIGAIIGFCAAIPFFAIEAAGFFMDNQRGSTIASSFNPALESEASTLGIFFTQVLTALLFTSGAFLFFLDAFYQSYVSWPVTTFLPSFSFEVLQFFLGKMALLLALAVLLCYPVIIGMFLSELALGLVSRFAQQLNVFAESLTIKSAVAITILILYSDIMLTIATNYLFELSTIFNELHILFTS